MPNFGLSQDGVERIARALGGAQTEVHASNPFNRLSEDESNAFIKEKSLSWLSCMGRRRRTDRASTHGWRPVEPSFIDMVIDHPDKMVPQAVMPKVGDDLLQDKRAAQQLLKESKERQAGSYLELTVMNR